MAQGVRDVEGRGNLQKPRFETFPTLLLAKEEWLEADSPCHTSQMTDGTS